MTRSSIQVVYKGDIIVERVNGKNRMIPVRKVEFDACSSKGVHINTSMCYDYNAVVELVDGEATLGDLQKTAESVNSEALEESTSDKTLTNEEFYEELAALLVRH